MTKHEVRVYPGIFRALKRGLRTLDLLDDDGFQIGDEICYREFDPAEADWTGDKLFARVNLVGHDHLPDVPRGQVRLSIALIELPIRVPGNLEEERRRRDAQGTGDL